MLDFIKLPEHITVDVTRKHIYEGIKCTCNSCPVALATTDIVGIGCRIIVTPSNICIYPPYDHNAFTHWSTAEASYVIPMSGRRFIRNFDSGHPTSTPVKFDVEFKRLDYTDAAGAGGYTCSIIEARRIISKLPKVKPPNS